MKEKTSHGAYCRNLEFKTCHILHFVILLSITSLTFGCSSPNTVVTQTSAPIKPTASAIPSPTGAPQSTEQESLRYFAEKRSLLIGTEVNVSDLRYDDKYAETLKREFNLVVPEIEMKFAPMHPAKDVYYFRDADYLVNFAQDADMQVRGHALLWYVDDPQWVQKGNFTKDELIEILHDHISTVVGRYKGRIFAWDVVNEGINDDGSLRDNVWLRGIGTEYIDLAFQFAHEADPNALLFYNDTGGEGLSAKSNVVFAFVKSLRERNVPINGVGMQMHATQENHPTPDDLRTNIERLSKLGLIGHITEMDVRLHQPASESDLTAQAQVYKEVLQVCISEKACRAFLMWGFTDKYSWIPNAYPGFGDALIFDNAFKPKPAYDAIKSILAGN